MMPITRQQWNTLKEVKRLATGKTVSREILKRAHRIGYAKLKDASGRTVAAYVAANLKSEAFLAALEIR